MVWANAGELDRQLSKKYVPILGCAVGVEGPHPTQFAASFIPCGDRYVRLDWKREAISEEREAAIAVVREGCPNPISVASIIDSVSRDYPPDGPSEPMRLSPILGYYWPRVWLEARPGPDFEHINLTAIHDLVYESEITQGIRVKAFRLGFFVFDFSTWAAESKPSANGMNEIDRLIAMKMHRIRIFNAHLICLYNAIARADNLVIDKMSVTHEDTVSMSNFEDPFSSMGFGRRFMPMTEIQRYSRDFENTHEPQAVYAARMKWFMDFSSRFVVSEAVLKDSFAMLENILNHSSEHSLLLVEILAHSCKAFEDHYYSLSLITAWGIIEKLLQARWQRYIDDHREVQVEVAGELVPLVNSERAKKLRDGNNFTASVVTETLVCLDQLQFALYKPLNQVRDARNKWMHELRPVTRDAAHSALQLAQGMLRQIEGIDLTIPVQTQLHL